ncbi:hypothetical protein [Streptomyces sp. NPDC002403]
MAAHYRKTSLARADGGCTCRLVDFARDELRITPGRPARVRSTGSGGSGSATAEKVDPRERIQVQPPLRAGFLGEPAAVDTRAHR